MKMLIASPEAVPYVKTGGLAYVAGALCKEYRRMNIDANIIMPLYKKIKERKLSLKDTRFKIKVHRGKDI
jgi:starch synthase